MTDDESRIRLGLFERVVLYAGTFADGSVFWRNDYDSMEESWILMELAPGVWSLPSKGGRHMSINGSLRSILNAAREHDVSLQFSAEHHWKVSNEEGDTVLAAGPHPSVAPPVPEDTQ